MKKSIFAFCLVIIPLILAQFSCYQNLASPAVAFGLAIFSTILLLWLTELIPLAATSLLVPCLITITGVGTFKDAIAPFADSVIYLFIGAFLLAHAMAKHRWDLRIAYWLLGTKFASHSFYQLAFFLGLLSFVLSMWVSNTATVAMLCPIAIGITRVFKEELADKNKILKIENVLLLFIAYSASIGGIATPVGSPPNLIALSMLSERGIHISFFEWIGFALPVALFVFLCLFFLLRFYFGNVDITCSQMANLRTVFSNKLSKLGKIKPAEIQVACVFTIAVFFWLVPGVLASVLPANDLMLFFTTRLTPEIVALVAALILFFLPSSSSERTLELPDLRAIDWGTIILFGGGLSLGSMLSNTGISKIIGDLTFGATLSEPILLLAIASFVAVFLTEVASNTACSVILITLLLGMLNPETDSLHLSVILATCLGTSLAFMLPVGTPPNAIVYGTGRLKMKTMVRVGLTLNLTSIITIFIYFRFFYERG